MDGIIIIDKEKEYTSHDVVAKVKKILNVRKVGHTGTLDPNATGVLPILLNKGTNMSKYLIEHDKIYEVTLKLGEKTDTADIEGKLIQQELVDVEKINFDNITTVLNTFLGETKQKPPMYSAIKVKGKKLYEYARDGQTVEVEARNINIHEISLNEIKDKEIIFTVHCSKGTYMRTLCENIAEKLGTVGYMKDLCRKKVGIFDLSNSIKIGQLEENKNNIEFINSKIITIEKFFERKEKIVLNNSKMQCFLNGIKLNMKLEDHIYKIYDENNNFIGTATIENEYLKRDIIL